MAYRRVGADCLDYRKTIQKRNTNLMMAGFVAQGLACMYEGASNRSIELFTVAMAYTCSLAMCINLRGDVSKKDIVLQRTKAKRALLALSIPEQYVDKHFNKIVKSMLEKYDEIKKADLEREKAEQQSQDKLKVSQLRNELGLPDNAVQNLDAFLEEQQDPEDFTSSKVQNTL